MNSISTLFAVVSIILLTCLFVYDPFQLLSFVFFLLFIISIRFYYNQTNSAIATYSDGSDDGSTEKPLEINGYLQLGESCTLSGGCTPGMGCMPDKYGRNGKCIRKQNTNGGCYTTDHCKSGRCVEPRFGVSIPGHPEYGTFNVNGKCA